MIGETPEPSSRRRERHPVRWALGISAALILLIVAVSLAASGGGKQNTPNGNAGNPTPETTFAPPTSAAPATSAPVIKPANRIAFVITGNVPASQFGGLDIIYGSDSDTHDVTLNSLAGKVKYVVPFDGNAQYYSIDVTFSSAGSISCRIVVLGPPPDSPLTVSHGTATGGNNGSDCSAQAAPNDSTGESWQNEQ